MASDVEIINVALAELGDKRITSINDDTEEARLAKAIYDFERDALQSIHPWGFAKARLSLAQLATAPAFGWTYAYQLPSDCLRPLILNPDSYEQSGDLWAREGNNILTDASEAKLLYIARITDPTKFPIYFAAALSAQLAAKLCYPLTESSTRQKELDEKALFKLQEAKTRDSQGRGTPQQSKPGTWITSRQ